MKPFKFVELPGLAQTARSAQEAISQPTHFNLYVTCIKGFATHFVKIGCHFSGLKSAVMNIFATLVIFFEIFAIIFTKFTPPPATLRCTGQNYNNKYYTIC